MRTSILETSQEVKTSLKMKVKIGQTFLVAKKENQVLKKIKLDQVIFKGYAFQICMKFAAIKHGFVLKEIPITFIDRVLGESKMSTGIFKEAFFGVWKMRKMDL